MFWCSLKKQYNAVYYFKSFSKIYIDYWKTVFYGQITFHPNNGVLSWIRGFCFYSNNISIEFKNIVVFATNVLFENRAKAYASNTILLSFSICFKIRYIHTRYAKTFAMTFAFVFIRHRMWNVAVRPYAYNYKFQNRITVKLLKLHIKIKAV